MKILIESTTYITKANGQTCRVWRGVTDGGTGCHVLVALLAVAEQENQRAFEAELRAQLQPAEMRPLREVLMGSQEGGAR